MYIKLFKLLVIAEGISKLKQLLSFNVFLECKIPTRVSVDKRFLSLVLFKLTMLKILSTAAVL